MINTLIQVIVASFSFTTKLGFQIRILIGISYRQIWRSKPYVIEYLSRIDFCRSFEGLKQWERGSQGQSHRPRSEWTSLILSSVVPSVTMAPVLNAAYMKNLIGEAVCLICQESFSTTITALTEPIDIYSEWIDECERVNNLEDDGA